MENRVSDGKVLTLTAPSGGVVSGSVYKVGSMIVVAVITASEAESFTAENKGVFTCAKTTSQAWAEGDPLYWVVSTSKFSTVAAGNTFAGYASAVAGSADTTGSVLLVGAGSAVALQGDAVADVATADGSDATTTQALANALKVKVNALLAELRQASVIAT